MRLPDAARLRVEERKVTGYLLSLAHPRGRSKAIFFMACGFQPEHWTTLQQALLQHGGAYPAVRAGESRHGVLYTVEGELGTPSGRAPLVRTVWIAEAASAEVRLVSAYPIRRRRAERT